MTAKTTRRVVIELPFPPTSNNMFCNNKKTGGRFPSKEYKLWKDEAHKIIQTCKIAEPLKPPYIITILLQRPDKRRRDGSNYIKAVEDALVEMRVIEDDSYAMMVTVGWLPQDGNKVSVHVASTSDAFTA